MSTRDLAFFNTGLRVYSASGKTIGHLTGQHRPCSLEGCTGMKLQVEWPEKTRTGRNKTTWCCTKGMILRKKSWRIG